mmetsp:Transcript_30536/g.66659  ORF Transcript_30536/g.66659 Transcript_30536/m.66659 type:complete len:326 (-) Transcript_30536:27-1004(-)|eukprot:CAMPEP_0118922798 /NCGR_PEP_ID=MMETSP1169-20130426/1598_1 /TAXON_ID=36882 /ORGANISM="Pyramimonas obovata, Strain CCMP722" /LENGTH=325 /DNA_ID=CAMNT_0006863723 /DNA_START=50 /DNA_END=1027 /DNA_ORIENTATION=+
MAVSNKRRGTNGTTQAASISSAAVEGTQRGWGEALRNILQTKTHGGLSTTHKLQLLCAIVTIVIGLWAKSNLDIDPETKVVLLQAPVCCEAVVDGINEQGDRPFQEIVSQCVGDPEPSTENQSGVLVLTHVPPEKEAYARYSVSLMAVHAREFSHELVVERGTEAPLRGRKADFAKIYHLWQWMQKLRRKTDVQPRSLFWLDADTVVVDFDNSLVERLIARLEPEQEMIIGGEFVPAASGAPLSLVSNTGTMLLRVSEWSESFLQAWWKHPYAQKVLLHPHRTYVPMIRVYELEVRQRNILSIDSVTLNFSVSPHLNGLQSDKTI